MYIESALCSKCVRTRTDDEDEAAGVGGARRDAAHAVHDGAGEVAVEHGRDQHEVEDEAEGEQARDGARGGGGGVGRRHVDMEWPRWACGGRGSEEEREK
jgi:hypothetical protein